MFWPLVLTASIFTFYLPGDEASCIDRNTNCRSWAGRGECGRNPKYMNENCKKSCKLCTTGGSGCIRCKDTHQSCAYWSGRGECTRNPSFMRVSCRYSCKVCTCTTKPKPTPPPKPKTTTDYPSPPIPVTGKFKPPPIPTEVLPSPPLPSATPLTGVPPIPTTTAMPPIPPTGVPPIPPTTEVPPIPPTTSVPPIPPTGVPPIPPTTAVPPPIPPTTAVPPIPVDTTLPPLPPGSVCKLPLPVGIEVGSLPNEAFKASTSESSWHQPDQARLNNRPSDKSVGAWCAGLQDEGQSIEVDLGELRNISAIITQGRESGIAKYVTSYHVDYSKDGTNWNVIHEDRNPNKAKEFVGNTDTSSIKKNKLRIFVVARHLRIRPKQWNNMICMRLEFEFCPDVVS